MTQGTDTSVLKHRYRSRIYIDTFMVGMSRRDGLLILVLEVGDLEILMVCTYQPTILGYRP